MNELIKLFDIPKDVIKDNERQRRVYSTKGISPGLLARADSPKIVEIQTHYNKEETRAKSTKI